LQVEGASLSPDQLKRLIPVFEEGSVDETCSTRAIAGCGTITSARATSTRRRSMSSKTRTPTKVTILYKVRLGPRRRVERVTVAGNRYFDSATLERLLSVHAADSLDRHGAYSQALVSADVNALQAAYQNNGFSQVKVTAETSAGVTKAGKAAPFTVVYHIDEGAQRRVGTVRLEGNEHVDAASLTPLLNTVAGQLLSPETWPRPGRAADPAI